MAFNVKKLSTNKSKKLLSISNILIITALIYFQASQVFNAQANDNIFDCSKEAEHLINTSWKTDFSRCTKNPKLIRSGGPGKDGIPAIDNPKFQKAKDADYQDQDPVISLKVANVSRAYPLSILMWHEIVNDNVAGMHLAITYCPLCNASIVFDSKIDGVVLDFGTTGNLLNSDLVMYDRQTETWWQQYSGEALIGKMAGKEISYYPSRLESFKEFLERNPEGEILKIPQNFNRAYGANPYRGYDSLDRPFLFDGELPDYIAPMERVVVVEGKAWSLNYLKKNKEIIDGDIKITWAPGQASALDKEKISMGKDVGTVSVGKKNFLNIYADTPYKVTFAFVYHAFSNGKKITTE